MMLEHRGGTSGKTRRTVLEVVAKRRKAFYVAAPWKSKAQWLQNIVADPHVVVHCGFRRFGTVARVIDSEEARSVLDEYATKHPGTFRSLAAFMLDDPGGHAGGERGTSGGGDTPGRIATTGLRPAPGGLGPRRTAWLPSRPDALRLHHAALVASAHR
ncbi:MAG: nitroreductase family deazaflavin-dependent oxidoreductase [Acidimicrobiia bacterium]